MTTRFWALLSCLISSVVVAAEDDMDIKFGKMHVEATTLEILSPPGAGYDSATGDLRTTKGATVTFSRASAWTCRDTSGTIRSVATNKPCVVDGQSLRVRSAVSNNLLHSNDLSQAAWTKTDITLATDGTLAPDGTAAAKVSATTGASTLLLQAAVVASTSATCSVFVKKGSGATDGNKFILRNATSATVLTSISVNYDTLVVTHVGGSGATATQYPNGWIRIAMPVSAGVVSGNSIQCYVGFTGGAETAGEFFYGFGGALTPGAVVPGDYCPTTTAAATCAAETATTVLSPAPAASSWCLRASLIRQPNDTAWNAGAAIRRIWTNDETGNGLVHLIVATNGALTATIEDSAAASKTWSTAAATLTTNTRAEVRACYDGAAVAFWVDGVSTAVTPAGAGTGVLPALSATNFLGSSGGGALQLNAGSSEWCFDNGTSGCQ